MAPNEEPKNTLNSFTFLQKNFLWQRLLLVALLFLIVFAFLYFIVIPERIALEVGRPSPTTIYAPREAIDYYTTENLKEAAAEAVPETYEYEPAVLEHITEEFHLFMARIYQIRQKDVEEDVKVDLLKEHFPFDLDQDEAKAFMDTSRDELEGLEDDIKPIVTSTMEQGIKANGLENAREQVFQEITLLPYSKELRENLAQVAEEQLAPNMIFNEEATQLNREQAREEVEPVKILKGSLIISEGETVTEKHMAQMESVGLQRTYHDHSVVIGLGLLLLAIFLISGIYLYSYEKDVFYNPSLLLLLGIILFISLLFALAANIFSGFLIPVAMGIILTTVLFNSRLGILLTIVLSILTGIITGGEFSFIIVALLGGLTAVYSVSQVKQRSDLTRAGFYVSLINILTIISVFLFFSGFRLEYGLIRDFSVSIISGLGNGLFSAVMAIGLLPFLESAFGLTTSISLLEMANPNQPLLRQLMFKSPGTYHHSIIVANLAEAAAETLEADPLLSRVGAYYHDIGKTRRPYFFIENQLTNVNPHSKISSSLSTLIITSHVKDGVEMAQQAKLPGIIQDIIRQHHGTSLISYFYHQAQEIEKREELNEDRFRYEGPKPQTKEAAIIMLADSVEAAVRAMSKPNAGKVGGLTRKIIKDKLNDGQLDESDLTLKDLDKIAEAFTKVLSGIFHSRIEYPEKELKAEIERGKAIDSGNKQSTK